MVEINTNIIKTKKNIIIFLLHCCLVHIYKIFPYNFGCMFSYCFFLWQSFLLCFIERIKIICSWIDLNPWLRWEQANLTFQLLCIFVLTCQELSEGLTQGTSLCFI